MSCRNKYKVINRYYLRKIRLKINIYNKINRYKKTMIYNMNPIYRL